jgi:hypothetical protein
LSEDAVSLIDEHIDAIAWPIAPHMGHQSSVQPSHTLKELEYCRGNMSKLSLLIYKFVFSSLKLDYIGVMIVFILF